MKFIIFLAILIAGTSASEDDPCPAEVIAIRDRIIAHVNDDQFDYMNSYRELVKLHGNQITEEEFGTYVEAFCPKVLDGTKFGIEQFPTISEGCVNDPNMIVRKNMLKFFSVAFGKLCKDNGQGYKDIVKNKGTKCFFGNDAYKECFKTHNTRIFAEENFKQENICNYVKAQIDCESHLDSCDNPNIKLYQHEINLELKEQMNCSFD